MELGVTVGGWGFWSRIRGHYGRLAGSVDEVERYYGRLGGTMESWRH